MSENLKIRFDHLKEQLLDPNFQANRGLSNEVGYYIFDYPADHTIEMNKMLNKLKSSPLASKVNLKVFDVYDIMRVGSAADRTIAITINIQNKNYDLDKDYYLVIKSDNGEKKRIKYGMDLFISNN